MSTAVLDCIEQQEFAASVSSESPVAGHFSHGDSSVLTAPRWVDEEDDGVAVRSYD